MKKGLLFISFITIFANHLLADDLPMKISVERKYNQFWDFYYPQIKIISTVDNLTIKKVTINKGNCKFSNSEIIYKNREAKTIKLIPRTLKYGEKVEIALKRNCQLLRIDIDTDQGSWKLEQ